MFKKAITIVLIFSFVGIVSTSHLLAQTQQTKEEKQTEKVRAKIRGLGLGERVKVKIKLYDKTTYQGYVSSANADDFVVMDKMGSPHVVKYSDVRSVSGKNLSTGAKIAIGVGIGVAGTLLFLVISIKALNN